MVNIVIQDRMKEGTKVDCAHLTITPTEQRLKLHDFTQSSKEDIVKFAEFVALTVLEHGFPATVRGGIKHQKNGELYYFGRIGVNKKHHFVTIYENGTVSFKEGFGNA